MTKYILKRILLLIITLLLSVTIVFFLLELMKGFPSAVEAKILDAKEPEEVQKIIATYEQHGGVFSRFWTYISDIFTKGSFGIYYAEDSTPIFTVFTRPLKWTFLITVPAFILGSLLGMIFGFIAGYKRGRWPDVLVNIVAVLFVSIPSFVLATFIVLIAQKTGIPYDFQQARLMGKTLLGLLLPILIITITSFSTLTYYIRNEVVEVLSSDYISIARAKGNSEKRIFFKHVIRNISIPLVSIILPMFVFIVAGSMIIEIFFNVPGSSSIFASAIKNKEKYIILFSVIFYSSLSLTVQLVADVIYTFLDPRIKLVQKNAGIQPVKIVKSYFRRSKQAENVREVKNGK